MKIIEEFQFADKLKEVLADTQVGCVTGPGRSGAIAAVYASHLLSVPFIPYGSNAPADLGKLLIIDTATKSGRTLRKAGRKYKEHDTIIIAVYNEPPRLVFWYEVIREEKVTVYGESF